MAMSEADFERSSRALLDQFRDRADGSIDAADAGCALDYKWAIQDPLLTHWVHDDVDDLLLGFLPSRMFLEDDEVDGVVDAVSRFLEFLEEEGHMAKGSTSAADLVAHLEEHRAEFREVMADPETGGHAKRLLMAMRDDGVDFEDEEAVDRWLAEFNAGPIERRESVVGPAPDPEELYEDGPAIELPPRPPVDEDLARASAARSPLLRKIIGLAEYMGEGRRLTATGNLKLADARELVDLLETGDRTDYRIGEKDHSFRSATELIWLDMLVWLAREVRAVKVQKNKMSATQVWRPTGEEQPLGAASEIADIIVTDGPLSALFADRLPFDGPRSVVDASAASLLAGLYEGDRSFDDLVATLVGAIPNMVELPSWYYSPDGDPEYLEVSVGNDVERIARVLEWAGLLTWTGAHSEPDRWLMGERWRGGTLSLTDFGSWFVQGPLTGDGLVSAPVVRPLTATLDDSPEEIVEALVQSSEAGPLALVEAWEELGGYRGLPEQLWRVDRPDTAPLLEALGQFLPDKATAKAARKALLKHRSWLAGRS